MSYHHIAPRPLQGLDRRCAPAQALHPPCRRGWVRQSSWTEPGPGTETCELARIPYAIAVLIGFDRATVGYSEAIASIDGQGSEVIRVG
jgi:hypothetical protein